MKNLTKKEKEEIQKATEEQTALLQMYQAGFIDGARIKKMKKKDQNRILEAFNLRFMKPHEGKVKLTKENCGGDCKKSSI